MLQANMKGSFAAAIAMLASVAVLFAVNSAVQSSYSNESAIQLQAYRETALRTDNFMRLIDKATAEGFAKDEDSPGNSCNAGGHSNVENYLDAVLNKINSFDGSEYQTTIQCQFYDLSGNKADVSDLQINPGAKMEVNKTGNHQIGCAFQIGGTTATKFLPFRISKSAIDTEPGQGKNCVIYDDISRCTEHPAFDPACSN